MSDSTEDNRMDPTRPLEVDPPPSPAPDPDAVPASAGTTPVGAAPTGSVTTAPVTRVTRGPNAGAIVLGVLCLVLAGLAIARETSGFRVDWGVFGPGAIVGVGVLVLVLGILGLVRRQR